MAEIPQQAVNTQTEFVDLKVGTVKVDLDCYGNGTVSIDGHRVLCQSGTISFAAGKIPTVQLVLIPCAHPDSEANK